MNFLLDTNVFISAKRDHYRFKTFPGFWKVLLTQGTPGHRIETLIAVRKEIEEQEDDLTEWVQTCPSEMFVPEQNSGTAAAASRVATWVTTHPNYLPSAVSEFLGSADFWLVSHALAHGHTLVTHELSKPDRKKRVMIPDACKAVGAKWCTPWQMLEDMGASF